MATTTHRLQGLGSSQISINSFGYGGINAHCVLDAPHATEITRSPQVEGNEPVYSGAEYLFVLSARSQKSGKHIASQLQKYVTESQDHKSQNLLASLAYTLAQCRSKLTWRAAVVARSMSKLQDGRLESLAFNHIPNVKPKIAFVFSGQGAHWYAMGREGAPAAKSCIPQLHPDC